MAYVMQLSEAPVFDKATAIVDLIDGRMKMRYLRKFDPEGFNGRGTIVTTDNIDSAQRFGSFAAVLECWKTQSRTVPFRPDGKPNRPLTAYSASPVRVDD